jgi:hypothetical protein
VAFQSEYDDDIMPLFFPPGEVSATHVAAQAARDLVVKTLRAWTPGKGTRILIFSNAHFLTTPSWALLEEVVAKVPGLLVVLTSRSPIPEPPHEAAFAKFAANPRFHHRVLGLLTKQESLALVDVKLREKLIKTAPALMEYIAKRSQGHPLLVEELVRVVLNEGVQRKLVYRPGPSVSMEPGTEPGGVLTLGATGTQELDTLSGVLEIFVNMRMDLVGRFFQLDLHLQLLLKVASVVGGTVAVSLLQKIYPQKKSAEELKQLCEALVKLSIFSAVDLDGEEENVRFKFKVRFVTSLSSTSVLSFIFSRCLVSCVLGLLVCHVVVMILRVLSFRTSETACTRCSPWNSDGNTFLPPLEHHIKTILTHSFERIAACRADNSMPVQGTARCAWAAGQTRLGQTQARARGAPRGDGSTRTRTCTRTCTCTPIAHATVFSSAPPGCLCDAT